MGQRTFWLVCLSVACMALLVLSLPEAAMSAETIDMYLTVDKLKTSVSGSADFRFTCGWCDLRLKPDARPGMQCPGCNTVWDAMTVWAPKSALDCLRTGWPPPPAKGSGIEAPKATAWPGSRSDPPPKGSILPKGRLLKDGEMLRSGNCFTLKLQKQTGETRRESTRSTRQTSRARQRERPAAAWNARRPKKQGEVTVVLKKGAHFTGLLAFEDDDRIRISMPNASMEWDKEREVMLIWRFGQTEPEIAGTAARKRASGTALEEGESAASVSKGASPSTASGAPDSDPSRGPTSSGSINAGPWKMSVLSFRLARAFEAKHGTLQAADGMALAVIRVRCIRRRDYTSTEETVIQAHAHWETISGPRRKLFQNAIFVGTPMFTLVSVYESGGEKRLMVSLCMTMVCEKGLHTVNFQNSHHVYGFLHQGDVEATLVVEYDPSIDKNPILMFRPILGGMSDYSARISTGQGDDISVEYGPLSSMRKYLPEELRR